MESLELNSLLDRNQISTQIKSILSSFDEKCKDVSFKKGIYIYGSPGCGKTHFVMNLLKELDYDVIRYDAGDVRNGSLIKAIKSDNVSNCNVLNMMYGKKQKIAIVMDEIDGMNSGDKGGIVTLIKLIRQKKTKRQKLESVTLNPIICIGNYFTNKKILELMKVCNVFELKKPTSHQIENIVCRIMPSIVEKPCYEKICHYIQGDIRKLLFCLKLYRNSPELLEDNSLDNVFYRKSYNDDVNHIVRGLFHSPTPIESHGVYMNETQRTIVSYLWHENIVDLLNQLPREKAYGFYLEVLGRICFADYTDRIMFQSQIWGLSEMSSIIKTFHNNARYHEWIREENLKRPNVPENIRFTKILTKYSTEYNNLLFLFKLFQSLEMDKKDIISFFQELRLFYGPNFFNKSDKIGDAEKIFDENSCINRSAIKRIYRYLDKNVKLELTDNTDNLDEDDDDDDDCIDMSFMCEE